MLSSNDPAPTQDAFGVALAVDGVSNGALPEGEQLRLEECVRETIRTPGAIQRHGALLAVDAASLTLTHASDNTDRLLGFDASDVLGMPLAAVLDPSTVTAITRILDPSLPDANPAVVDLAGQNFDVIVHESASAILIEFEPQLDARDYPSPAAMYGAMHRLTKVTTNRELWDAAVTELGALTGFDRVVIYHFHDDGHGEVVAEHVAEGMDPFLGLHYPASDIPAQARELYLTKLSRIIASSANDGAALLSEQAMRSEEEIPLDLGTAELRSVSPHHLQFMRNMGQAATYSLSLINDGVLVGMITCAHREARRIPFIIRQGLEVLANQVALQLGSMTEIRRLAARVAAGHIRSQLITQLTGDDDIAENLLHGQLTVLDLVPADGATVCLGGDLRSLGDTPSAKEVTDLVERLMRRREGLPVVTSALALEHPILAEAIPGVAGLILLPLGGDGDFVAWYRREMGRTVNWMGDQTLANRETPLSPRNSFTAWSQSVTGVAAPWNGAEVQAAELCRDLDSAMLRRAESKLAGLALHDPLTGLPNRRLLMDRLEHALTKYARGEELAVLFIDLDGFKAINDGLGHDTGDELLVHVARKLESATRSQDTVARIGGDEFVVVCENTTAEEADVVAARIVRSVRAQPIHDVGMPRVTASVGVTSANLTFTALELLREADAAMYRAKARGRDQASR